MALKFLARIVTSATLWKKVLVEIKRYVDNETANAMMKRIISRRVSVSRYLRVLAKAKRKKNQLAESLKVNKFKFSRGGGDATIYHLPRE